MTQPIRFGDWYWYPNTLELRNGSHVATLEPRVARLFEYLVAHPGELLSRDRLVDAVWEGRVVSDEAVRRAVFSLRQAFAVDGGESYIRTIHKKGYVATFPTHVAIDEEALKDLSAAPMSITTPHGSGVATIHVVPIDMGHARVVTSPVRLILFGIVGTVALVAAVLTRFDALWERELAPTHTEVLAQAPATIAVLPFINLSEEPDSEILADGLAEELLGTLARNRDLRVTARSSAFQFKGQNRDVREVGRRLGVRYVLEGSVRKSAERVRIDAQLIDADTGMQLWSEVYDRTLGNWFGLQQDVAGEVARALDLVLEQGDKPVAHPGGTTSVEAHFEFLRARELLLTRSVADAEQAIEHLQRALTLDPNYALAYARLADAILIQAESTTGMKAARPVVAPLLDKALALDPGLGEAYALRSMLTDDAAAAERDLRHGLELNPSYARGYELLANLQMVSFKQLDLAVSSIDRAIALDPLTPGNLHSKATLMMWQGDFPEAAAMDRRALELNPEFRAAIVQLGTMTAIEGNFAEAIGYTEKAVALDPRAMGLRNRLMLLYLAVGDIDSARAVNMPPTVADRLAMLWAAGDIQHAADMVYSREFGPLAQLAPEFVSQLMLLQALSDQGFTRARTLLSAALPFTEALPPDTNGWRLYAYANLAQLLAASGEASAASRLQQQIDERMAAIESRYPRYALLHDQVRATLLAHAGHSDEACAALERTYARAPRLYWRLVIANPAFDGMRSMPRFQALLTRFNAHVATERVRIDAMRRAGQIPDRSTAKPERGVEAAS